MEGGGGTLTPPPPLRRIGLKINLEYPFDTTWLGKQILNLDPLDYEENTCIKNKILFRISVILEFCTLVDGIKNNNFCMFLWDFSFSN